ncbi:MAG: hypothetical protein EOP47_11745 [Sphingobacteriaceae bacterium]|nr:MAG: hypothetical protein EOP47_11745 [Sphingobacteriaceae bacterium]
MKKIIFVLPVMFFVVISSVFAQKLNCAKFKNGTFKMTYQGKETIIVRNGNQQQQYYDGSKEPTIYAVKWVNSCTLNLIPAQKRVKELKDVPSNAYLTQKIIKTSKNSYTQLTSANFSKRTITTEIYKIK